MTFAASAATGFCLNASDCGVNGSSKSGNESLLSAQTFSSSVMEVAIKLDNATRVESIEGAFCFLSALDWQLPMRFYVFSKRSVNAYGYRHQSEMF